MATFPTGLYSHTTLVDNVDDVLASHPNTLGGEIVTVETKIGIDSSAVTSTIDYFLKHTSGAYRTHIHDATSDDGANIPIGNISGTRFKIGTFTRDVSLASGTQAITGVGFQPKAVLFLVFIGSTSQMSIGIDTDTEMCVIADQHGTSANTWTGLTTMSILLIVNASNYYQGNVNSFDSDGFTINWTKNNSPTGTASIYFLALR